MKLKFDVSGKKTDSRTIHTSDVISLEARHPFPLWWGGLGLRHIRTIQTAIQDCLKRMKPVEYPQPTIHHQLIT